MAVSIIGPGANAYFTKQGTWYYPQGDGYTNDLGDYQEAAIGGINEGAEDPQNRANELRFPVLSNPSNGMISDLAENLVRKVFWGWGDSIAAQFAAGVNEMAPGASVHGFSGGSSIITFAAFRGRFADISFLDVAGSPVQYGITRWAAGNAGARFAYRTDYFDVINLVAPSYNPIKFLSGFAAFNHQWTHYYH